MNPKRNPILDPNPDQVLESSKASLGVTAYAVSQPTLEQVFLAVVGHGLSGEGDAGGVKD